MKIRVVALSAMLALAACGGGSMSGTGTNTTTTVGVATSGVITAFGSVFVNGVRYDISAARLQKNGKSVAQSALAVGEVALVHGKQDRASGQGSAETVEVENNVVGPAAAISVSGNTLSVLEQKIIVTASTSFGAGISPADLSGLAEKDVIEVSGLVDTTGTVKATRIARAEAGEALQVLGSVASLSATAHTFSINALNIDFSTATLSGFTSGQPADGDKVVVRGTAFEPTTHTLTATAVARAEDERSVAASGEQVELEGLVTSLTPPADFAVNDSPVTTNSSTVFKGGSFADLAMGARVEVRGTLDANKVLVADVVEINHIAAIALEATVEAVDSGAGTLKVLGVNIGVDTNTRFEDKSAAQMQMFTLANLNMGEKVLVRAFESPAGSGRLLARRLERLVLDTNVEVRGPFTATSAPMFQIFGIVVDATTATFGGVEDEQTMTSPDFFTQAVGKIVEARGTAAADVVSATQVRIDQEEDR